MGDEQLLSISEYAIATQTPERTVRHYLQQGKLRGVKLGKFWYILVPRCGAAGAGQGRVLTFFTHAGGAGKTSLVRDVGFQLASQGLKVLLIDADPQANLSTWLGCEGVTDGETLLTAIESYRLPVPRMVQFSGITLSLVPANVNLALAEIKIPSRSLGMFCLRTCLNPVLKEWDYILIDSPPSLGSIAGMAALAGAGLVVPVETSGKGLQALKSVFAIARDYESSLQAFQQWLPGHCFVRLIIPTKYDARTSADKNAKELLAGIVPGNIPVAIPIIYRPAPYKDAISHQCPIHLVGNTEPLEEIRQITQMLEQTTEVPEWV